MDWNEAPKGRRGWSRWLLIPAVLIGAIALMVFATVLRAQGTRTKVWPIVRQTASRLQTDEGALDLYRRNPDLAYLYPTEAAFLDRVHAFRAGLAKLPEAEPRGDRNSYQVFTDPWSFRALVKGEGEAWMLLRVQGPGPLGLMPGARGEGISILSFSDSKAGAREESQKGRMRHHQADWDAYQAVLASLATDEGAKRLYRESPGLAQLHPGEGAFLDAVRSWRPKLEAVPKDIVEADTHLDVNRFSSPIHPRLTLIYAFKDLRLKAVWERDRLVDLGPATAEDEAPKIPAPPEPPEPSQSGAPEAPDPQP